MKKSTTYVLRSRQDHAGSFDFIEKISHNEHGIREDKKPKGVCLHDRNSDQASA